MGMTGVLAGNMLREVYPKRVKGLDIRILSSNNDAALTTRLY